MPAAPQKEKVPVLHLFATRFVLNNDWTLPDALMGGSWSRSVILAVKSTDSAGSSNSVHSPLHIWKIFSRLVVKIFQFKLIISFLLESDADQWDSFLSPHILKRSLLDCFYLTWKKIYKFT